MSGILLNTNAYVAFSKGIADAVEIVRRAPSIVLSVIVLGELRAGFAAGKRESENQERLDKFLALHGVEVLPIDDQTTRFYASLHANLRAIGRPLPTNDIWIASSVLQHNLELFTYDQHFASISGIRIGTAPADFNL